MCVCVMVLLGDMGPESHWVVFILLSPPFSLLGFDLYALFLHPGAETFSLECDSVPL